MKKDCESIRKSKSDNGIAHFVESVRPSLKGKNYNVCFTDNKTW